MTRPYEFRSLEEKGHRKWSETGLFSTPASPSRKHYVLEMFAYPSGDIHMGHFRNYSIGDAVARYRMMLGDDVFHPFGWDAFGLPAENAAIKHGTHPRDWTLRNIATGRSTLQRMGLSYDWDREVVTCEPDYYRWTQWLFLLLYERGLAYRAPSTVNWCANDGILANEQVHDGKCWRCETVVEKKEIGNTWFFKYTDYAQRLLDGLDGLDQWPENVKTMQRNWISRSEGCEIDFSYQGEKLTVFTTRPDTTWGVTFMVIAPEHAIAKKMAGTNPAVAEYIRKAALKSDIERTAEGEKDGVNTGETVVNPLNGETVQLWVADYVVAGYGTGVVMGVPAHDTRDFAFAKKYDIPIRVVIEPEGKPLDPATMEDAWVDEGVMVRSGEMDGTPSPSGIPKVIAHVESKKLGRPKINFRLKDWLISRQRYWGCPIPFIHCETCGAQPVPEKDLPVLLPLEQRDFVAKGRSPLADNPDYMKADCPKCGKPAERDPDTMDTFMCSSFYLFRYLDPKNTERIWEREKADAWLPVDIYIGGVEHACMHLLYFRFLTKVLHDAGLLPCDEPVVRLFNHGMVLDAGGDIMSKSKGNAVSPSEMMNRWGVDVCRIAMFFFAPSGDEIRWKEDGLVGAQRFVQRVWNRILEAKDEPVTPALERKLHQTIQRMSRSMEKDLQFNTAISALMELLNAAQVFPKGLARDFVRLLAPLAPFLAEELWESLGESGSVFRAGWPAYDAELAKEEELEIPVQMNGKLRGKINVPADIDEDALREKALALESVVRGLEGRSPRKVIVVKGRLVNIVV